MKYPGIPPAGSGSAGVGWDLAGSDLGAAAARLRGAPGLLHRVQLAEVLRRAFKVNDALGVLRSGSADEHNNPLVLLAEGNALWTVGDATSARPRYARALRTWQTNGHDEGALAATLGLARCARLNYRRKSRRLVDQASEIAIGITDVHLLADLDRERAAWALLSGDHDAALAAATRAAKVHRDAGDRYLAGLADVLRARALNGLQDAGGAIELMRGAGAEGREIGSADLDQVATVYLGQFLQRGVSPDSPRWVEAEETLAAGLARATDPFTRAELLLPLAHLHTASGEFTLAEQELAEYGRIYAVLGGNEISTANLLKARARLDLARHGLSAARPVRRTPVVVSAVLSARMELWRAARAYRKAGLDTGRRSVEWHISLVDVLSEGRTPGAARLPRSRDPLELARYHLLAGEALRSRGRMREAGPEYAAAESNAVAAGSTMLAVASTSGAAEVAHAVGDRPGALTALRSTIDHAERIRAAIVTGTARINVAQAMRSHYERVLLLAARMGDGALALEIIERLRTERLAGLLGRTGTALPPDLYQLLSQLNEVYDALLQLEPGIRSAWTTGRVQELEGVDADELRERRAALHAELALRTNELFADIYGAVPLQPDRLAGLQDDILALLPLDVDGESALVAAWRSGRTGETTVTVTPLDETLSTVRDVLTDVRPGGWIARVELTWRDLRPLTVLLPPPLRAALAQSEEPTKLVIVPTGWLWAVPFAAVPLGPDGRCLLVDRANIVLSPSLRFYTAQQARAGGRAARAAVSWVDVTSQIRADEVDALDRYPDGHTVLDGPPRVREAFVRGGARWRTAVLAAHGNREPGLAHAVIAGRRSVLAAADFLDGHADPPRFISFASCHSGYPEGDDPHEPLGIALAALAAGCDNALSAHFEIDGEGGVMTHCLAQLYLRLAHTQDVPAALADTLRDHLIHARVPPQPLFRWAALAVIGTHSAVSGETSSGSP